MVSGKCISHFKMLWTVSGTYYGEVALSSPIFFFYIYLMIYTVDFLFCYTYILFLSHYFWFSNLCHHQDPIFPIGILKPMMLLLWTVHHSKDLHYSNVECILGGILKMPVCEDTLPNPWGFSGVSCICSSQCSLTCQNTTWIFVVQFTPIFLSLIKSVIALLNSSNASLQSHLNLVAKQAFRTLSKALKAATNRRTVRFNSPCAMFSKSPTCSSINVESPPVKTLMVRKNTLHA